MAGQNVGISAHFNPLSPHGERRVEIDLSAILTQISIHSPHTGRDGWMMSRFLVQGYFNPLSPHGERLTDDMLSDATFISIHSPHTGRDQRVAYQQRLRLISIHSPHTGRDQISARVRQRLLISIHSPHTGRDTQDHQHGQGPNDFNPLSPHGERPTGGGRYPPEADFNPLSPHGERRAG